MSRQGILNKNTLLIFLTVIFVAQAFYGYRGSQQDALGPPLGRISGFDFEQILVASQDIINGENLYRRALAYGQNPTFEQFVADIPSPYPYQPIVAVLALPLIAVDTQTALELWSAANLLMLIGAAWLAASVFGVADGGINRIIRFVFILVVFFLSKQTQHNLQLVQLDIFILFMLMSTYTLFQRGNKKLAGIPFAFALVTKVLVLPILVYFLWKRSWQTAAVALGVAALISLAGFFVVGWERLPDYLEVNRLWSTGDILVLPFNQSLRGLSLRAFTMNSYIEPLIEAPWLVLVVPAVGSICAVVSWLLLVSRIDNRHTARGGVEYGFTVLAGMSLSPLIDDIHIVWTLLPIAALLLALIDSITDRRSLLATIGVFGLVLYLGYPSLSNLIYSVGLEGLADGSLVPASQVPLTGVYTYGLIVLYVFITGYLFATRAKAIAAAQVQAPHIPTPEGDGLAV